MLDMEFYRICISLSYVFLLKEKDLDRSSLKLYHAHQSLISTGMNGTPKPISDLGTSLKAT